MAENVLKANFEDFEQAMRENAKNRILDLVGCLISGANAPGNLALIELVKSWGGKKEATILVHGGKAPAIHVAMVNSIMARSYDFEAVMAFVDGVNFPSHISGTTVMASLALGEQKNINGKELITALLVGEDLACRLLASTGFEFTKVWDFIGTVNTFAVTAIAGRLLGLTKTQMINAFGIALNQLSGSLQNIWDGTMCFKLPQGLSARNGIFSAELAKAGWNGPEDAFLSKFGYFNLYTGGCTNPEILIRDLGRKYFTEATFKLYPCCRASHTAVDCALNIANNHKVSIDKIDKIILKVPSRVKNMFVGKPFKLRENPQIEAAFNLRYCVATALLRKSIDLEHFREELIREPKVISLINKITIKENENQASKYYASIKIEMKDGKELFNEEDYPKGDPVYNPISINEIREKFMKNVAYSKTVSEENAKRIINLINNLEEVKGIGDLIELLVIKRQGTVF
jgi:2-methylcitrate dehydratase PrpD